MTVAAAKAEMVGDSTQERYVSAGGQRVRVSIRPGSGVPLVLCNGIGAGLEVLDPLVAQLDPDTTVVRFDVPGTGESPPSLVPYGFPYLAWMLGRVLTKLGLGVVDVLGLSWGGALAQQFAFQHPRRCRRLILVSTGTGMLMVPGGPRVLSKMLSPRRFRDPEYAAGLAGHLYGGSARRHADDIKSIFKHQFLAGSRRGYLYQLSAGAGWTSLPFLRLIRQPTLVLGGDDDPIVPLVNARILACLIPHATLHIYPGGHVELVTEAETFGPIIGEFLADKLAR